MILRIMVGNTNTIDEWCIKQNIGKKIRNVYPISSSIPASKCDLRYSDSSFVRMKGENDHKKLINKKTMIKKMIFCRSSLTLGYEKISMVRLTGES